MLDWWSQIPSNEKVYWFIAFPFTALFLIQTLMTFIGLGNHSAEAAGVGSTDVEFDDNVDINDDLDVHSTSHSLLSDTDNTHHGLDDTAAPFKLLTLRNIIIFFTIFSWGGIVFTRADFASALIILVSGAIGLLVTLLLSSFLYFITRLTESGSLKMDNAINCIGEVYLTVPEKRKGYGKIQVTVQGSLRELDAMTEGEELSTGTAVIVTGIVDNQYLLVEKYI